MVACPEEFVFAQKWITADALEKLAKPLAKNTYGQYLLNLLKQACHIPSYRQLYLKF
jgi:glucose-1-phosphate thymidylyltransferase